MGTRETRRPIRTGAVWPTLFLVAAALTGIGAFPLPLAAQAEPQGMSWAEAFLRSEPPGPKFGHAWVRRARSLRAQAAAAPEVPFPPPGMHALAGTFNVAVLPGAFADVVPLYAGPDHAEVLFGDATGDTYSLKSFYLEASGGAFTFQGTVLPWITLDSAASYYLEGIQLDNRGRYQEYMHDLLVRADTLVDWRLFDNDGPDGVPNSGDDDGFVDMVILLHPLADGVCGGLPRTGPTSTGFQLHRLNGPFQRQPYRTSTLGASGAPLLVDDFVLTAGLGCDGVSIAPANIAIHEMGHALGLPDLYDRDDTSYGVGTWDVMGFGVYSTPGHPSQLGAWSRQQLGWLSVRRLTQGTDVRMEPVVRTRTAVRIDVPGTEEYYLLENRRKVLADAGLPGEGLVVWHVDDALLQSLLSSYAAANDETHPGVGVLQADGRQHLGSRSNQGDGGDPFPGDARVTVLSDATEVNLLGYGGAPTFAALTNIAAVGEDMAFRLDVSPPALAVPAVQTLRAGILGELTYDAPLEAVGGAGTYTFLATGGVPAGMRLLGDGRLTGAPGTLGDWTIRFTVTDELGQTADGQATFAVVMPEIAKDSAIDAVLGGAALAGVERRALDLAGNRNGRLDVGDLWLVLSKGLVR